MGKLNQAEGFGFDEDAEWKGDLSHFDKTKEALETSNERDDDDDGADDDGDESKKKMLKTSDLPDIPLDILEQNMGEGKPFPGGPVCDFNGKRIPSFVTSSESGGITAEILVEILQHLDKHGVSNRTAGEPPPCLILDGHGSRLSVPFLRYINNLDETGDLLEGSNHVW